MTDTLDAAVDAQIADIEHARDEAKLEHLRVPMPSLPMPAAVQAAYSKYVADHHGDLSDIEGLVATMWNAGGRHAVTAMVVFGDIVPQLNRIEGKVRVLLELLEAFQ